MRKFFLAFLLLACTSSQAQTPPSVYGPQYAPNWYSGYIPTPFEWGLLWSNKLDYNVNGLPVIYGGTGCTTVACIKALIGGGALIFNKVNKTADYTVLATDYLVNCLTNAFTVTLPTTPVDGEVHVVKNSNTISSANNIVIAVSGGQTIDGDVPSPLLPLQSLTIQFDLNNNNWVVE